MFYQNWKLSLIAINNDTISKYSCKRTLGKRMGKVNNSTNEKAGF